MVDWLADTIRDAEADWPADTDSDAEADHSLIPMDAEARSA